MSVDSLSHDQRLGGYGAVWMNSNIENQFGNHEGKFENTLNFLVMVFYYSLLSLIIVIIIVILN